MTSILRHPVLGAIRGTTIKDKLYRCYSLPYASIPQRFARSELLEALPEQNDSITYDATKVGPSSIQLLNAAHTDASSNQLPTDDVHEQDQAEGCLRLTLTRPLNVNPDAKLPVVVFIHGGAFFLGSGDRAWLNSTTFCLDALSAKKPIIFVSVNYRLGLLGFLHSTEAADLMPANNALYDQVRAFEWIREHIGGFGGDPGNVTALGQSAGGESLSLHNLSGKGEGWYKRAITLSGTLVTMPAKTPGEYQGTFLDCAGKMGVETEGRSSGDVAGDMLTVPIDKIREANFVGAPCTESEVLPYEKPTMEFMRSSPETQVDWLESHVISSCTYDGSISYIMTHNNSERKDYAAGFVKIAREVMKKPDDLLRIYGIEEGDGDNDVLRKICLFESDIGFVSAAISQALGVSKTGKTKTYLQIFDLGNPFEGLLKQGEFASHTWDIVALLGAYEDRLSERYRKVIQDWRRKVIEYVNSGTPICGEFRTGDREGGLLVDKEGVREVSLDEFPGAERRMRLWKLADGEKGERGLDYLWEGVCRRWLDQGE